MHRDADTLMMQPCHKCVNEAHVVGPTIVLKYIICSSSPDSCRTPQVLDTTRPAEEESFCRPWFTVVVPMPITTVRTPRDRPPLFFACMSCLAIEIHGRSHVEDFVTMEEGKLTDGSFGMAGFAVIGGFVVVGKTGFIRSTAESDSYPAHFFFPP